MATSPCFKVGYAATFTHPNTNLGKTTLHADYLKGYDDENADPNSVAAKWEVRDL